MKNRYLIRLVLVLLILPMIEISMGCNKKITDEEIPLNPTSVTPVKGVRIAWDYSSLKRVAPDPSRSLSYCGYARLIELDNGDFLTVYETSDGNIELIRSTDGGEHWSSPSVIFTMKDNIAQCVPDIIELDDHSIKALVKNLSRNSINGKLILSGATQQSISMVLAPYSEQYVYLHVY